MGVALIFTIIFPFNVEIVVDSINDSSKIVEMRAIEPVVPVERVLFGDASYYDYVLDSGWSSKGHFVAAVRDFPRYSYVLTTNLDNNKTVCTFITDFGPSFEIFPERIIDLSSTAFAQLANLGLGVIPVSLQAVEGCG